MDSASLKEAVCKVVDALSELLMGLSAEIHRTPELSFEEHKAVQLITDVLGDEGFEIEKGIAGLETAFLATYPSRSIGPTIVFLAEYDALPGVGHACGHNIIAGSAVGAALAIGKLVVASHLFFSCRYRDFFCFRIFGVTAVIPNF